MAGKHAKVHPYVYSEKTLKKKKKQPKTLDEEKPAFSDKKSNQGIQFYFRRVCNGFSYKKMFYGFDPKTTFTCGLLHHNDPYLRLAPFKYETASVDPFIMVFHDIINQDEIDHFVNISTPNLSRERNHLDDVTNMGFFHEYR